MVVHSWSGGDYGPLSPPWDGITAVETIQWKLNNAIMPAKMNTTKM